MTSDEDKGFKISDRRTFRKEGDAAPAAGEAGEPAPPGRPAAQDGPEPAPAAAPETRADAGKEAQPGREELPPMDFTSFLLSLATQALVHLGDVPDPVSGQPQADPPLAKHTIDLISLLQEKTRGNLTPKEESLLQNILADLRMRYLKAVNFIA